MYDFTTSTSRFQSNAEKYTLRKQLFGTEDVLPAWVADMDIDTPDFVLLAVKERLKHPVVGYEEVPDAAYEAQAEWLKKRHGLKVQEGSFFYSHSVVASMCVAIEACSEVGDEVIVQTPVYPPFFHSVTTLGRKVLKNPLKQDKHGHYRLDLEDLRAKITPKTKLLLLCSPHNPVGRVWKKEELEALLALCQEHNIYIFADEIHSDLVYTPHKHTPFCSLEGARERTMTAYGVGKTFNMAGFAMSSVVVEDAALNEKFTASYEKVHFAQGNVLSHVAFEAAYKHGEVWLEELLVHLKNNYTMLQNLCTQYDRLVKLTPIEGTYLAWIDCSGMELRDKKLREFFVKEARLGLNAGISFGKEGSGFMRLNFAVSYDTMREIIQRLDKALQRFARDND